MLRYFLFPILAVLCFGCQHSSSKVSSKTARINIGGEPQSLDPRKARDLKCQTLSRMLFEGLTRIDQSEKAQLALAEKVDISSDLKTYTFHLKESVWSNGDRLTASDFAYAWKKALSPDFPSDTAFHLYAIKNARAAKEGKVSAEEIGITIAGDKTLVIELEKPTPYFLDLTAIPAFFPVNKRVDEENPSWAQNASTFVGNGPFLLSAWKHQDQLVLEKNKNYWDATSVKLASLELQMLQEETELKMFEKGELDWAGSPLSSLPVDALKNLKESGLKSKEILGTFFIRVNTENLFFKNPAMRKAFALAINRRAIVDHVTQGDQIPATGLVPTALKLQKDPYFQDGDLTRARALFEETLKGIPQSAKNLELDPRESSRGSTIPSPLVLEIQGGLGSIEPRGFDAVQSQVFDRLGYKTLPEITLLYAASERSHLIAQALQQQWHEAFGVRVKLERVESKVWMDRISKQDYMLSIGSWTADFADPINFLEVFKYKDSGSNNTLWENARFTALLEKASLVSDVSQRLELLAQSEQILMEEMPMIPIFYYSMLYVNRSALKDVVLSSMGQIDFKWASLEEAR